MRSFIVAAALLATSIPAMSADAEKGAKVFNRCKACHVADAATNKVGPNLFGIIGRKAASVEGFNYSDAMKAKGAEGLVWDAASIKEYMQ
jgi:cytochrome c